MKKLLTLALAFVMLFCVVSCESETYKTDVPTSDIASAIDEKITNSDILVLADDLYFSMFNAEYASLVSEYTIKYSSSGALYDEYGIFKVDSPEDTEKIVTMIEEFIQYRIDADTGYFPGELPKIKDAEIKVAGVYVMYAFLSATDASAAFAEFQAELAQ